MSERTVKVIIYGHVQGVGFRYFTMREADKLGIRGHAINLVDGCVEVLASGHRHAIDTFLAWLAIGPRTAQVERIVIDDVPMSSVSERGFRAG